jgi:hypothetical protein
MRVKILYLSCCMLKKVGSFYLLKLWFSSALVCSFKDLSWGSCLEVCKRECNWYGYIASRASDWPSLTANCEHKHGATSESRKWYSKESISIIISWFQYAIISIKQPVMSKSYISSNNLLFCVTVSGNLLL